MVYTKTINDNMIINFDYVYQTKANKHMILIRLSKVWIMKSGLECEHI